MTRTALSAPRIFDGERWHADSALLVENGKIVALVAVAEVPAEVETTALAGALVPGFLDLQINGGGGILLNDDPSLKGIERICAAQYSYGTTALLPTLITDTFETTQKAIEAGIAAQKQGVPGFAGLHLEGPHLSVARKGAHKAEYIRPMDDADIAMLIAGRRGLASLIVTVAAETVLPEQIAQLSAAGVIVSIGHSDATAAQAQAAFAAGASMSTHLFNAMSQMGHREPGVVGATLEAGVWAGLIADGIHVHPTAMGVALRGQKAAGRIFLVTDGMAQMGTDITSFRLNGQDVIRKDGALRLANGTLAGADLTMVEAIRNASFMLGVAREEALRMASVYPAAAIGRGDEMGHLRAGADASIVHLDADDAVADVWIKGTAVYTRH